MLMSSENKMITEYWFEIVFFFESWESLNCKETKILILKRDKQKVNIESLNESLSSETISLNSSGTKIETDMLIESHKIQLNPINMYFLNI